MSTTTNHAVGFAVRNVLSAIEGVFGAGFVLGTNITLDVQTVIGSPVARNTPYSISYTDPADNQLKTKSILHEPSAPFQDKLPENTVLTLTVPESTLYLAFTGTFTIAPNTQPVWRVRLSFKNAAVITTKRTYF